MVLSIHNEQVRISVGEAEMEGALWLPDEHIGVVLLANGGISNRLMPPGDYVASVLRSAHLATLWLDLLSPQEARSQHMCADIKMLARRLSVACGWLKQHRTTCDLPIGLFGVGHGAAAVLQLAAEGDRSIAAVVSRGGCPDPAMRAALSRISAPTLLIVGGLDERAIALNRAAYAALRCKKRFEIIPGATRSFEEPGSLEVVARFARNWFLLHAHSVHA